MKTFITIFISIIVISNCFAQKDLLPAFSKEITYKGGIAYFNNIPFSGVIVDENTNKKMGEFKNGFKNSKFIEYYPNGKKKTEGKYINGLKEEVHILWYENGNKESECNYKNGREDGLYQEWYPNKQLKFSCVFNTGEIKDGKYATYNDKGQKEKEDIYKDGLKTGGGVYKNGQFYELSTVFYANRKAKNYEGYLKNGIKDGLWTEWYENGELKSKGLFIEGKEDSIWTWWYMNGEKKKEIKYEKGIISKLIYENDVDPAFSINTNFKPNAYLFRCLSNIDGDTVYVMVNFNFDRTGKLKELIENLLGSLRLRMYLMNDVERIVCGKKMLKYSIDFSNPLLTARYDNGESTTSLGIFGQLKTKTAPGFRGKSTILMKVSNMKTNLLVSDNIIENESDKYKNQNDAYSITPTLLRSKIIDQTYHVFKIKTLIKSVLETNGDGNAETVSIMCGKNLALAKGFIFFVYSEDDLTNKLGEVEIDKVEYDQSECDVNEGEEIITKTIKSGKKIVAISKY